MDYYAWFRDSLDKVTSTRSGRAAPPDAHSFETPTGRIASDQATCLACQLTCQARGRVALWVELPISYLAEVGWWRSV